MEELSKQQLILLALLISFVTSLATGIFTVSLMSQAPQGVVQSIGQVVEKTIERAVFQNTKADAIESRRSNSIGAAYSIVLQSTVTIRDHFTGNIKSLGLIVTNRGVILSDKSSLVVGEVYDASLSDGRIVPVSIIQSQVNGDIVFLAPTGDIRSIRSNIVAASFASTTVLGQDVYSMSFVGSSTPSINSGIVSSVSTNQGPDTLISTNILTSKTLSGSPVFDSSGSIVGIHMASLGKEDGAVFYSVNNIKSVIPSH